VATKSWNRRRSGNADNSLPGQRRLQIFCPRMQSSSSTRPFKSALSDARSDADAIYCHVIQHLECAPD
jgi:hypothetical protein